MPRVPTRRDHTGGLIEHVIPLRAVALHLPVHRNRRSLRIELGRRIADHLPFHRHTAGADERLHFFPAAAIEVGEQFIQTHLGHFVPPDNPLLAIAYHFFAYCTIGKCKKSAIP